MDNSDEFAIGYLYKVIELLQAHEESFLDIFNSPIP